VSAISFDLWEQPRLRWLLLFVLIFVLAASYNFGGTPIAVIVGFNPEDSGVFVRFAVGAAVALVVTVNFFLIRLLPFKLQVVIFWLELLLGLFAFFYSFDLSVPFIQKRLPILIFVGAFTTLYVSLAAIAFACVLALLGALAKLSRNGPAYAVATFYISFFRGTPLLLQIFLIYTGFTQFGLYFDAVPAGIMALALCYGAYMAEIFRAGIEAVPIGQREASTALGLSKSLTMRKVVLPQAMKLIVPPTGNQFIAMLKDSSLVSVIGVHELTFLARTQGRSEFKFFEMLVTAAVIYWIMSICFEIAW